MVGHGADAVSAAVTAASVVAAWPHPKPLEGVKSKRKPIFEVASGGWVFGSEELGLLRVSGLRVLPASRIAATGGAAHLAVDLLLGKVEPGCGKYEPPASVPKYAWLTSSKVVRHEHLEVVHLGPHLAGAGASEEAHLGAVAAAFQGHPQIVVLDEAEGAEDAAWATAFAQLVAGAGARSFRGGLVVRAAEETDAVKRLCSDRWVGGVGWMWQEVIADDVEIIEDALAKFGPAGDNEEPHPFFQQVRELSEKVFVMEDSAAKAREKGWTLTLLTESIAAAAPEPAEESEQQTEATPQQEENAIVTPADGRRVCGFMCHRMVPKKAEFHVHRLAVVEESRGRGHGRRLMHWALEKAARMPSSKCAWISLSSYDEAMHFYEHFGFTDMTCDDHEADEDHFQTWMELQNISARPDMQEELQ